jgi:hypothetical protein
MAVVVVGMAVGNFLSFGIPDAYHGYLKIKIHPRQGMISVHRYDLIVNGGNSNNPVTLGGVGGKLHPYLQILGLFKLIQRHLVNKGRLPVPVGVRRGDGYFKSVSLDFTFQGPFQTGDKVSMPVEVVQGLGKGGGIDKTIFLIGKGVTDANHAVFNNIHDLLYHITRAAYSIV